MSPTDFDPIVAYGNFPDAPDRLIERDHVLDTLDRTFEAGSQLVAVEGPEGIGKSTLLAQFAIRHVTHSVCLFITPTSRFAYAPEYLRDLVFSQVHRLLGRPETLPETVDESLLFNRMSLLHRKALRENQPYYFVIDGLSDIREIEPKAAERIAMDILPLGLKRFRFLLAGDAGRLTERLHSSVPIKPFPLLSFSLDDALHYFTDFSLDRSLVEGIYRLCQGIPGRLSSVRRLIRGGMSPVILLREAPGDALAFLAIEWRQVSDSRPEQQQWMAVPAFARDICSVADIARTCGAAPEEVRAFLTTCNFLRVDDTTQQVTFVSESHRQYACQRLTTLRTTTLNRLIDDLLREAGSDRALTHLPSYYEAAGRFSDLVEYLSPEHFLEILSARESLSPLRRRAQLGLTAAQHANRGEPLLRFTMQQCVIEALDTVDMLKSEIEARLLLGQNEAALALAHSAVLKEDKLHLLATILRVQATARKSIPDALRDEVRALYSQIDVHAVGERGFDIACELISFEPDLAIRLIEALASVASSPNALNLAFAKLSLAVLMNQERPSYEDERSRLARGRIKDRTLQEFADAAHLVLEHHSATEVIAHTETLEPKNRLFMLRQWVMVNAASADAAMVIEHALDVLLADATYTPKTRDLRELAVGLATVEDAERLKHLVRRFDSLRGTVERLGTTEDYVRLQMLLARADLRLDRAAAENRLIETFFHSERQTDPAVRVDCLAWMLTELARADPDRALEGATGLFSEVKAKLQQALELLLATSAEHYEAAKGAIRALAVSFPDLALQVVRSLNTEYRRDRAGRDLVRQLMKGDFQQISPDMVESLLESIDDPFIRSDTRLEVISTIGQRAASIDAALIGPWRRFLMNISALHNARDRCVGICHAYHLLVGRVGEAGDAEANALLSSLEASWEAIDSGWVKLDTAFTVARILAGVAPAIASNYVARGERIRAEVALAGHSATRTFLAALRLAVRAYAGLLPRQLSQPQDLDRLEWLIARLPGAGERATIWADLAERCALSGREDLAKRFVTEKVIPEIRSISEHEQEYHVAVLTIAAAALQRFGGVLGEELIEAMPRRRRDAAYAETCNYLLYRKASHDPYQRNLGDPFVLRYHDALDVVKIMDKIEADYVVYGILTEVVDGITAKRSWERLTLEQRVDIGRRLTHLVEKKFPDPRNIRHDGYKIAARAQVERISQSAGDVWRNLLTDARRVPNDADRALVLCIVTDAMPGRLAALRTLLLSEIRAVIDAIPAEYDRQTRLVSLAETAKNSDGGVCKNALTSAMGIVSRSAGGSEAEAAQRRILDLAHRLDPSYAASLAGMIDDDPARAKLRAEAHEQLKVLNLKKGLVEGSTTADEASRESPHVARAAWLTLGSLIAERIETRHTDEMREYLKDAAALPLPEAYPILAWVIENAIRRVGRSDAAGKILVPMFEGSIRAAELAERIASRWCNRKFHLPTGDVFEEGTSVVVKKGEKEKAVGFVEDWCRRNASGYLIICDPYFRPDDVEALMIAKRAGVRGRIWLVTSRLAHKIIDGSWEDRYRQAWVKAYDQVPPDVDVTIVGGAKSGKMPIHDRWWLTHGSGLRFGSSFNGLGLDKTCEISIMSESEAAAAEREVRRFIGRAVTESEGERFLYTGFPL